MLEFWCLRRGFRPIISFSSERGHFVLLALVQFDAPWVQVLVILSAHSENGILT